MAAYHIFEYSPGLKLTNRCLPVEWTQNYDRQVTFDADLESQSYPLCHVHPRMDTRLVQKSSILS